MPRFFFDIDDGYVIRDRVGRELDDVTAARHEASKVASGLVGEEMTDGDGLTLVLSVRCEDGSIALRIRMVCQVELT